MHIKFSAIIKTVLLTLLVGFFTMPQPTYANSHGTDNGKGNGGEDNGGHNKDGGDDGSDGAGGDAVPISGLGILLVTGVAYTAIKVYSSAKRKESLV